MYVSLEDNRMTIRLEQGCFAAFGVTAWFEANKDKKLHEVMQFKQSVYIGDPVLAAAPAAGEAPATVQTSTEKPEQYDERDAIKTQLTALNVPFNPKVSTDKLKKLLDETKEKLAEPVAAAKTVASKIVADMDAAAKSPAVEQARVSDEHAVEDTAPATEAVEAAKTISYVDKSIVVEKLTKYAAVKGKIAAVALLTAHNATKVSDLDPAKYQDFVAQIDKELAA